MLTQAQRASLQLRNPYELNGAVAEVMQSAVAELDPVQARAWAQEAGASMSLQAAAAMRGMVPMDARLEAEIQRFNPMTADEVNAQRIAELTQTNPYGKAGFYSDSGEFVPPQGGNLTNAMMLESLAPELAAKLKAEAMPAAPAHNLTPGEQAAFMRAGYSVPNS